jgi:methyl-accepting chemotaxis protein
MEGGGQMNQGKAAQKVKRVKYLISARFQLKYIGLAFLFMFITAAICSYTVYYTGTMIFVEKLSQVYPQGRLVALLASINRSILLNVLLIMPLIALIGLYLSHRIAGPIYRVERYLSEMAEGKLTSRISFRKGDEFTSLADKINGLTDSLRATISNQRTSLGKILTELDLIKKLADSRTASISEVDKNIDKIHGEIQVLTRELDRFKM